MPPKLNQARDLLPNPDHYSPPPAPSNLARGYRRWQQYWFQPAPLFNLALCRIIIVTFQLGYLFARGYWDKMLTRASLPAVSFNPLPVFQLLNLPFPWDKPPTYFLMAIFWVTVVSGVLTLIGWRTRLNLALFAFGNLYIQTYIYSVGKVHHSQALMLMTLVALALSPAGRVLSLDDLLSRIQRSHRNRRFETFSILNASSPFARWPLVLVQWLLSLIYLSAAVHKLTFNFGGRVSLDWFNGYTLQYYLIRDGLWWSRDLGLWLGHQHALSVLSSIFAVVFEATFGLTLFFPRLIWLFLPLGAMLHTGIYIAQRANFFQYLAIYAVFIPWSGLIKRAGHRLKWSAESRRVDIFYDGLCPLCIRTMTFLCYFDWFSRLRYRDLEVEGHRLTERYPHISLEDCRQEMHLLLPNGSIKKGFFAIREIIKYVPLLWPLLAVLYFPGIGLIGPKIYGFVAARRQRYERCSFDQCAIGGK